MKHILVTGTSRPTDATALGVARMVGRKLAECGFGMVTGNATGVDKAAADAFCSEVRRQKGDVAARFTQLALPYWRRGSFWPIPGYGARESRVPVPSMHEWIEEATTRCAAVVMVGGHAGRMRSFLAGRGARGIVDRFLEVAKPVFPIPFSGGDSDEVFQDILSRWDPAQDKPSRDQFLRLALPRIKGADEFVDLLLGTLAETPDIFISYRRDDTGWVGGRLHRELSEHFGAGRVFMDLEDIAGGDKWMETIEHALHSCRVGIVLIGSRWLEPSPLTKKPRLLDETDVVRKEIRTLLASGKPVIVVLAEAAPPRADELPPDLIALNQIQAIAISNATWEVILRQLIQTTRRALVRDPP